MLYTLEDVLRYIGIQGDKDKGGRLMCNRERRTVSVSVGILFYRAYYNWIHNFTFKKCYG